MEIPDLVTNISWVKGIIVKQYPRIEAGNGADLDRNGKIEKDEVFGDLNGDGVVDEKDFLVFLEKNSQRIRNDIEFIKWGDGLSYDNIANTIFYLESGIVDSGTIKNAFSIVETIIGEIKSRLNSHNNCSPKEKMAKTMTIINNYLRYEDTGLFAKGLEDDRYDCDTLSFLFLSIAEEMHWPLSLVIAPEHVFVKWTDNLNVFNFDQGKFMSNKTYITEFKIASISIEKMVYLSSLDSKQTIAIIYLNCGNFFYEFANNASLATKYYDIAVKMDGRNKLAFSNRGTAKYLLEDYAGAIADFDRAIELDPNNSDYYHKRGYAKYFKSDYDGAIKDYDRAIELNRKDGSIYCSRAIAKFKRRNYRASLIDIDKAIELGERTAEAYNLRADIRETLGDKEGAMHDRQTAAKIEKEGNK